jgi:predicted transposase YdaD
LKNSEIKSDTKVPGLIEAKEVMKFDRMTKEEQDTYIRHLDAVANEKEAILTAEIRGKIEGREEGIAQRNKEIAKEMKNNGMSEEVISVVMKLPVEDVKKLLNE